jgi:hypothetical protein
MAGPSHTPDWRHLALNPGILRETGAEDERLVLWMPGVRDAGCQHWQGRQGEILSSLGRVVFAANQTEVAHRYFEQALTLVRAAGDRYAEKLTLDRLATVQARRGSLPAALSLLGDTLTLARSLGDRQHEVDILWKMAIGLARTTTIRSGARRQRRNVA